MPDRFLATVALIVWCVAALVAVLFGLPLLLTLLGVHVDAGLIVSAVAASIALAAAVMAYQSVSRQIASNAEHVNRQIEAHAEAVSKQIAADRFERRRVERIDLVDDAITLVRRLAQAASWYEYWSGRRNSPRNEERAQSARWDFFALETLPICQKLDLLDMPEAAEAVRAVGEQARLVIQPEELLNEELAAASAAKQAEEHARSVLKAALSEV